jgi:hypothetical protein
VEERLIDGLVKAIFVYDDYIKVILTFDDKPINIPTNEEIEYMANSSDIQSSTSPKRKPRQSAWFFRFVDTCQIEKAKCEAFCGSSHFASKAMGARSREPRAKIFAIGEILPLHFILSPHQRCCSQTFCGFAANAVCYKTTALAVEQNSELSEAKHILPQSILRTTAQREDVVFSPSPNHQNTDFLLKVGIFIIIDLLFFLPWVLPRAHPREYPRRLPPALLQVPPALPLP